MGLLDKLLGSDKPKKSAVVVGQGGSKKSENKKLMDDIMNEGSHGGACRGPNCGHQDYGKKKSR